MSEIERVVAAIPKGKENAIHQLELSAALQLHPSAVKKCVKQARQQGSPILSSSKGYWLSESKEETAQYVQMMRRQALSRLSVIKTANALLSSTDGQLGLFDELTGVNKM